MAFEPWSSLAKVVNPDGTASDPFLMYLQKIGRAIDDQGKRDAAHVITQATAQDQANAASQTAAEAYEDTTGATEQERTAEATVNAGLGWTQGPVVTFNAAVSVAHVTSEDSGPLYFSQFKVPYMTGSVRLVQIISAIETVLATVDFTASMEDQTISCPPFAYDAASAATGEVSYRVDAKTDGGTIYTLGLRCHIKRAP